MQLAVIYFCSVSVVVKSRTVIYAPLQRRAKRGKSISEENPKIGDETTKDLEKETGARNEGSAKEGSAVNADSHSNNDEEWDSKSGRIYVILDLSRK